MVDPIQFGFTRIVELDEKRRQGIATQLQVELIAKIEQQFAATPGAELLEAYRKYCAAGRPFTQIRT